MYGALGLLGGALLIFGVLNFGSPDRDSAQISNHACIPDIVDVLIPGQLDGFADMTSELEAVLQDGTITLNGELVEDTFSAEDGLVIEIQRGAVECDIDNGY